MEENNIKLYELDEEQWVSELPKLIKDLVIGYNFYYSGKIINFKKKIAELVREKYEFNRHKIVLYLDETKENIYLVVYSKKTIKIYKCKDFAITNGSSWKKIYWFKSKFDLAYEEAVKWKQEQLAQELQIN